MALRKRWFGFVLVAVLAAEAAVAASPVEGGKVFSGPEGFEVTIVTVAPRSKNQAVVLFKNTESELDGKALLHEVRGEGDRVDYATQIHGRDWVTVVVRSNGWGGGQRGYWVSVPGRRDGVQVSFDEKKTNALKPEEVFALYEKQNKEGSAQSLQGFDRKGEQAHHDKEFAEAIASMNKACNTKISATIDWKSVSDDLLKSYSISSYCANPASALERLCRTPEGKSTIQDKVKKLSCAFGSALKLDVRGGNVSFVTEKDAANQEDFATQYFEKHL